MEPLYITQSIFRVLLDVMSRPGKIGELTGEAARINRSPIVAVAATLLDQETSYHCPDDPLLAKTLAETTEAEMAPAEKADFWFLTGGTSKGKILQAKRGSLNYPDQGATLIYLVAGLAASGGKGVSLTGPGIATSASPLIEGLDPLEYSYLAEANDQYPMGVDAIFVDPAKRVMALPRSTQLTLA